LQENDDSILDGIANVILSGASRVVMSHAWNNSQLNRLVPLETMKDEKLRFCQNYH